MHYNFAEVLMLNTTSKLLGFNIVISLYNNEDSGKRRAQSRYSRWEDEGPTSTWTTWRDLCFSMILQPRRAASGLSRVCVQLILTMTLENNCKCWNFSDTGYLKSCAPCVQNETTSLRLPNPKFQCFQSVMITHVKVKVGSQS